MNDLTQFLASYKHVKISILQLTSACPNINYEDFAQQITQFEQQGILIAVKAGGTNGKQPPLANTYKINRAYIRQSLQQKVKQLKKVYHSKIWLEYYLSKSLQELEDDLPYLQKLNDYLLQYDFPQTKALAQERSFEIFQNEKWITEHGGKQILEKVKVWDLLEIWPIADPVSFAINPKILNDMMPKLLIVENKATFYSLLPALQYTPFAALLYGQGNAINGTIDVLPEQLPLNYEYATFYYFGDIDAEGISIWYKLQQKCTVQLALPFYEACLQKKAAKGKEYQRKNDQAIEAFTDYFSQQEAQLIIKALQEGNYYPQEILNAEELGRIWRNACWT